METILLSNTGQERTEGLCVPYVIEWYNEELQGTGGLSIFLAAWTACQMGDKCHVAHHSLQVQASSTTKK